MKSKHTDPVDIAKNKLIQRLNKIHELRRDIWMKHVWNDFAFLVACHHSAWTAESLANQMPEELRRVA